MLTRLTFEVTYHADSDSISFEASTKNASFPGGELKVTDEVTDRKELLAGWTGDFPALCRGMFEPALRRFVRLAHAQNPF